MNRKDYLSSLGLNTGRGRPSRQAMDAVAAYRAEHGRFDDDPATPITIVTKNGDKAAVMNTAGKVNVDSKVVREWARANNIAVGERGRIHPDVIASYLKDGGKTVAAADVKVTGKKDLRAGTPETSPAGSYWISVDKKYKVNGATACGNCRVSLAYHGCANPKVVDGRGGGFIPMILVRGQGE